MRHTLRRLTAQVIEPLDLSDDRLSHLLQHLSKPAYWHQIEHDLMHGALRPMTWLRT